MPETGLLEARTRKESQITQIIRRLRRNNVAMAGLYIILFLIAVAIFAPMLIPDEKVAAMDMSNMYAGPSFHHIFGTDDLGRDIFLRLVYGSQASLGLGIISTFSGAAVGIVLGCIVGYYGGAADNIIMRLLDIFQSIPGMLLAIAISSALGPGFANTILALAVGAVPMNTRLLRGSILSIRTHEYIEAAEKINCSKLRIMMVHLLPNSISPVLVSITMGIGNAILLAAGLSYIGLGVQPPNPEWGAMLSAGKAVITRYPHLCIFPGLCIMVVVLAFNMLGDGLRDSLDPRLKD